MLLEIGKYIGLRLYRRSYLLWSPVLIYKQYVPPPSWHNLLQRLLNTTRYHYIDYERPDVRDCVHVFVFVFLFGFVVFFLFFFFLYTFTSDRRRHYYCSPIVYCCTPIIVHCSPVSCLFSLVLFLFSFFSGNVDE